MFAFSRNKYIRGCKPPTALLEIHYASDVLRMGFKYINAHHDTIMDVFDILETSEKFHGAHHIIYKKHVIVRAKWIASKGLKKLSRRQKITKPHHECSKDYFEEQPLQ